jgi:hypothetical protein
MEVIIVFAKLCEKLIVEEVKLVLFMNGKVSLQVFNEIHTNLYQNCKKIENLKLLVI